MIIIKVEGISHYPLSNPVLILMSVSKPAKKGGLMENSLQVSDLIQIVFRRIKLLIIIPLLFAVVGLFLSLYVFTPVYRVQADLLVNQTTSVEDDLPASTDIETSLRLIETYQFIINSSRVRELILEQLDYQYSMKQMALKVSVETNPDTQIVSLYVEDKDPEVASEIANLYAKTAEQEISDLMQMDNVQILTEAKAENYPDPTRPVPVLYTIIAYLIGILVALLYIAISAYFNITIHTRKDVKKYLNVPLLGSIGMFRKNRRRKRTQRRQSDLVQSISRIETSKSDTEAFRALRTNIQFQKSAKNLQTLLITSSEKNEGKTYTAANLAVSMASDNKKTVLIDADLRKSSKTDGKAVPNDIGLTNYLSGLTAVDQIIENTSIPNLFIIRSGPMPQNPTELIGSLNMDLLLSELKKVYDIIIIDSSSMIFADPAILAAKVDGCVFISYASKTKVSQAQQAIDQLKNVHATILGAVLNNKKERNRATGY